MADFIAKLDALLHQDKTSVLHDRGQRRHALQLARSLCRQLEFPMDQILRMSWQEPQYIAALKVCVDLKVFDVLGQDGDFMSVKQIAQATEGDASLLHRLLRHVASMGALREKEPDSYALTSFTNALRRPEVNGGLEYWFDIAAPICKSLPQFLAENGYKNPTNMDECNWHLARNTKLTFFQHMESNPSEMTSFANLMSGYTSDRGSWLDLYPVQRLFENNSAGGTALVDVGGGMGHDAAKFREKFPQIQGRVIVQDLPSVVAQAKMDEGVEIIAHDFFTEQPVQGARCYYLHSILHDWPDDKAVQILQSLKPAFKRGHSKLIINECVIPSIGADPITTGLDLIMMGCFSSRERTEDDWKALLTAAGFRIVTVCTDTTVAYESIIEAELA